jgi:hypothetical protein
MSFIDVAVLILATTQAIEIFHHGSIMADLRAILQSDGDDFIHSLATCMFCLSFWVAIIVVLWWCLLPWTFFRIPIYALAVSRGANLLNDLTHGFSRTPKDG